MKETGPVNGTAAAGLVLLHGRGGSPGDMLSLLETAALPEVAAAAPEAPGNSWWPTSFLAPTDEMERFVVRGCASVEKAVAALVARRLPRNRIWICGFSQGACLALEYFARSGGGLAGVLAFSGGLVGTADAAEATEPELYGHRPKRFDYAGRRAGSDVWISVHERDPHIPLRRARESAAVLRDLGADVTLLIHPGGGHAVMQSDLSALRARLNR
ncbi:MAG: alpha/beta hydrolase [Gemmobacter sp.]